MVIASDCVASDDPEQHEASMLLMRHRFDMAILLASADGSCYTGQTLGPNGGDVML